LTPPISSASSVRHGRGLVARLRALLVDRHHVAHTARPRTDVVDRPVGNDPALAHDDRARAGLFHLGQVVSGKEDRPVLADLLDVLQNLGFFVGIEVTGRLVEDQDRRVVDQGLAQTDALPIAVGQGPDVLAERLRQTADFDHLLEAALEGALLQAADLRGESQVVDHRHVGVERRPLRQVPDGLPDFDRAVEDVEATHLGRTAGRRDEASQDAHGGGFSGPVRTEEAHDLTPLHLEADLLQCANRAEPFAQRGC
jgi:hypothetical protein